MKTIMLAVCFGTIFCASEGEPAVRFESVDVFIDTKGKPLAAYQFELSSEAGDIKIVGVEGGGHEAFSGPPYYDSKALQKNRIIIAAFNTGRNLPSGKTRVARIHLQVSGEKEPEYQLSLSAVCSSDGREIQAEIDLEKGEKE